MKITSMLMVTLFIITVLSCEEQSSDSPHINRRTLANGITFTQFTGVWYAENGGYRGGILKFSIRNDSGYDINDLKLTVELEGGSGWIKKNHSTILDIDCLRAGASYGPCEDDLFYIYDWYAQNSDPGLQVRQWNAEQNGGYLFTIYAYIEGSRYVVSEHKLFPLCRQ